MTYIEVTKGGDSTSPIVWVRMTPWTPSAMVKHVAIPGASGGGYNFPQGTDNCTTTLTGRVPWTAAGEAMFESIAGTRLTIDNGVSVRTGLSGTPTVTEANAAWIFFTLPVTED